MHSNHTFRSPVLVKACDFCADAAFVKAYACQSFVYLKGTSLEHHACEEWTACSQCAALIDSAQWGDLTERAVRFFVKHHSLEYDDVPLVRAELHGLHQAFRQYMIAES
jgi:hypothetical protein